jgi:PAS domain S-box-containing protein
VFERLAQAANAPVYGVYDVEIGRGAVGGYMLDSEGLGRRAAELAIDVVNGRRPQNADDLRAPRVPTFDGRQLRRWGISELQLPAGHVVQFRQVNLWEQYRGYIVGAISLVAIQMMLIAGLLVQRASRRRSEDALRQSEARNRAMLWALPDLMFVQNSEGVYLDYHAKDSGELLLPPEQFLGKNMKEVLPPEIADKFGRCLAEVTRSRELRSEDYSLMIDGELRHYEARVVPHDGDKVLSIIRDITERQRAHDALRQSEERFSKVFMASPHPMAVTTIEEGRYLVVNESFLAMSGYARDEVVGRTSTELGNWSSPEVRSEFVCALQDQGSVRNYETCFRAKSATRVLLLSGELFDLDGRRCILTASSDITERKRSEEALDHARLELARVSRLSAMGELAAAITHEVNQPLSAVIANAATCVEWLNQGDLDREEFVEALHDILSDAERASAVVQRTREAFKHVRIRQMDLDLNDLIRSVLALARTRLERAAVVVKTDLAPGLPLVRGDRVEIQQVVLNLVMNAVDAMEAVHGRLRTLVISTHPDSGQGVSVTVRDSGSGVSASEAERIFDTLYTTKDDGMGMGLAVSRSIVRAHGGRLRSIPVDGVGAVFEFVLPANGAHARA